MIICFLSIFGTFMKLFKMKKKLLCPHPNCKSWDWECDGLVVTKYQCHCNSCGHTWQVGKNSEYLKVKH